MSRKARKSQAQAKSTQANKEQTMTTQTQAKATQQHAYVVQLVKMGKPTATIWQANDLTSAQQAMWGIKADRHNVGTFHAVESLDKALELCEGYEIIEAEMPQTQTEIKAVVVGLLDKLIEEVQATIEVQAQTIEEPAMNTQTAKVEEKLYAIECYNEARLQGYAAVERAMLAAYPDAAALAPKAAAAVTAEQLEGNKVTDAEYAEELAIIEDAMKRIAAKVRAANPTGSISKPVKAEPEVKAEPKAEPKATKKAKAAKKAEPKPEVKSEPKAEPSKDATKVAFKKRHDLRAAAKAAVLAHPELRNMLSRGLNSKNEELVAVLTAAKAMTTKASKPAAAKAEVKVQACNIAYRDLQAMLKEARIAGKDVQVKLNAKANELMAEAHRLGLTK